MIRVLWSKKQSEVVVVIKGSHSISDWLLNFAMWTRSCRRLGLNYRIHAGFYHLLFQEVNVLNLEEKEKKKRKKRKKNNLLQKELEKLVVIKLKNIIKLTKITRYITMYITR